MGRNLDAVMADYRRGKIIGNDALTALAEQAIAADQAESRAAGRRYAGPVRASAQTDDDGDGEFDGLFQPRTAAEAKRRHRAAERVAASAATMSEAELHASLFPNSGGGATATTHAAFTGVHTHRHSDYAGSVHSHAHEHNGDAAHDPADAAGHTAVAPSAHIEQGR